MLMSIKTLATKLNRNRLLFVHLAANTGYNKVHEIGLSRDSLLGEYRGDEREEIRSTRLIIGENVL